MRRLRALTDPSEAQALYNSVASMLDKLAKRGVIHRNNASNQKSKLAKHVSRLAA